MDGDHIAYGDQFKVLANIDLEFASGRRFDSSLKGCLISVKFLVTLNFVCS